MVRAFESVCKFFSRARWSWPYSIVYWYLYGVIIEALNDKKPCPSLYYRKCCFNQLFNVWQIITFIHQEWHFTPCKWLKFKFLTFRDASIWHRSSIGNINWLYVLQCINSNAFENLLKHKMIMHSLILKIRNHFVNVPFRNEFRFLYNIWKYADNLPSSRSFWYECIGTVVPSRKNQSYNRCILRVFSFCCLP